MQIMVRGKPKAKARPRFVKATGHAYSSPAQVAAEEAVKMAFLEQIGCSTPPLEGPVSVWVTLLFKPESNLRKAERERMAAYHDPHIKKPDADNAAKLLLDALNGLAFHDDSQVAELSVSKCYGPEACSIVCWEPIERTAEYPVERGE